MSITQSLYTGVTGLSVMADGMSVVANNIANANAKGFKYDRAEFNDLVSQDLNSASGVTQVGRGARLGRVRTVHTQGGLAVTDRLTDLAIQGNGFFVVEDHKTDTAEAGGMFFTRMGALNFDKDGYLADSVGGRVMGYMADADDNLSSKLTHIRLKTNSLPPKATNKVLLNVNLDSKIPVSESEFSLQDPVKTSDFENTVNVYDSHGTKHAVTMYYKRVEDDEGISFNWYATVDGAEVTDADGEKTKQIASGKVTFNPQGLLLSEETFESNANFSKGADLNQVINFDFGDNIAFEEGNGVGASTSTAAKSGTMFHSQNGFEAGNLKSLEFDSDGKVKGYYTNGIQRTLGALALANFENIDGLRKAGNNKFYATLDSGAPRIGLPQTGIRGSIYASTLEESNVDLAGQFVNMIMTQRGFQANSRSITTSDSMIEEVVNMKR